MDFLDLERNLYRMEEASIGYRNSGWEARLAIQILNWTATEGFHPCDIINSRNLDSDIENTEKIGEPMFSLY